MENLSRLIFVHTDFETYLVQFYLFLASIYVIVKSN